MELTPTPSSSPTPATPPSPNRTNQYDFIGKRYIASAVSAILMIASVVLFFVQKPNWGIDFTGGTELLLQFEQPIEIGTLRAALGEIGLSDDSVQQVNEPSLNEFSVRVQEAGFGTEETQNKVLGALKQKYGEPWVVNSRFDAQVGALLVIEHQPPAVSTTTVQDVLDAAGVKDVEVRANQDENTFEVVMPGVSQAVQRSIAGALDGQKFTVLSVDSVGPKVGASLQQAAVISILATLGLVLLYVAFRFDLSFAPGAVIALFHDVILTMGIFVLLQREINVSFIGALLTIIGYSLNDTIVIYDRIRENMQRYRRSDLAGLINDSVNDTLGRTLSTAFTTLLAISAFLFMGGPVIENFALAMLIGIVVGAYSTVYVASPFILIMESIKPSLQKLFTPAATGVSTDSVSGGSP